MSNEKNYAAVRVCAIADIECSRGCGNGACEREAESSQPAAAPTIKQRLGSGTPSGHYWMRRDDRWYVIQVKDGHYRHCGASADIPLQDALALPIIPIQEPYPAPAPAAEQVAIPAGWLNEDRMSEIARKCEIECQAIPGTNMWQCAHMAVEETLRALAEPHMSMLIAEVCEDADGYKHIEAVIEDLDDLPKGMKLYAAPQPPAQATLGVLTPQMMAAGMFVKRSTFGPWIEVDKEEPGVVRLYHAPAQENARDGLTDEQILECATRRVPPREVPKIPELAFSRSQFVDVVRTLLAGCQGQPEPAAPARIEQLRKALFESRDAMHVMSNWVKKSDPAGHSWAVRMVDRANAALNGEPEPRAEVTNPFRDLLAALIDIYDDERNNAPEDRCYVEGAWSEVLGEARALFVPLPDPARVAAESPDWIKSALPPEGI
ncbi:hypothetical protein [Burkholderia cenocepacia]|uniref:hypothetical protein n=1 Tax=Burkholderia cenocepacia TaxID=95486 RepID=UPI002B250DC3|nr:hypothetical protein [Burkholderia cenocepacia]MEB2554089.1 hypothetical protein [Burkholderia cenocepacia]